MRNYPHYLVASVSYKAATRKIFEIQRGPARCIVKPLMMWYVIKNNEKEKATVAFDNC